MKTYLLNYMAVSLAALLLAGCNDSESDLLKPKVYFESQEYRVEVGTEATMEYDLQARISSMTTSPVELTYEVGGTDLVEAYNRKYGTEYDAFDATHVGFDKEKTVVPGGEIFAEKVSVKFTALDQMQEGKPMLLPIRIKTASLPTTEGTDIVYLLLNKPVRIMTVMGINDEYIRVPFAPGTLFRSVTYEALVNVSFFGNNNTVMGREGTLIFRIGDSPLVQRNQLQIAGTKEYKSSKLMESKKWYHLAFTYDQGSGYTAMYINGEKVSESSWDTPQFDLGTDFFIGKVAGFKWGERPFYGMMSEVRVWTVARTENQIKQNMLSVDPKSEGLAVYYHLNGEDQFQEDGKWLVRDASGNNLHGLVNGGNADLTPVTLKEPLSIK